jgi:hypothetical protein
MNSVISYWLSGALLQIIFVNCKMKNLCFRKSGPCWNSELLMFMVKSVYHYWPSVFPLCSLSDRQTLVSTFCKMSFEIKHVNCLAVLSLVAQTVISSSVTAISHFIL